MLASQWTKYSVFSRQWSYCSSGTLSTCINLISLFHYVCSYLSSILYRSTHQTKRSSKYKNQAAKYLKVNSCRTTVHHVIRLSNSSFVVLLSINTTPLANNLYWIDDCDIIASYTLANEEDEKSLPLFLFHIHPSGKGVSTITRLIPSSLPLYRRN